MSFQPVFKNITIDSLGGLGDGIATVDGKPLFIPKSCAGDIVDVSIVHENREGRRGAISRIISPGPDRTQAPCPHFSECGGCTLQQLSTTAYQSFKIHMLHSALAYAGFSSADAQMIFVPPGARRRVEFTAHYTPQGVMLGFNQLRSNTPALIDNCIVLEPELQALIKPLGMALPHTPMGNIKSAKLTAADSGIDLLLDLRGPADIPLAALHALDLQRISIRTPESKIRVLHQRSEVTMRLGDYDIPLPPDAFLQATKQGQKHLIELVLVATKSEPSVVDLFCGLGTYSFPLSKNAKVHAVEGDGAMIASMQKTIKERQIKNLSAAQRDLFKQPLTPDELKPYSAAVINPPRVGAKAQTLALAESRIHRIVMVSCNPATFGRDAKILKENGFKLDQIHGIDQFVWSPYLEIVAVFNRL